MTLGNLLLQISHRLAHGRNALSHIRFADSTPFEMFQPQAMLAEFPFQLCESHLQSWLL